jgi:hypothetical protein
MIKIANASVNTISDYQFGGVNGGVLQLEGTLHQVSVLADYNNQRFDVELYLGGRHITGIVSLDEHPFPVETQNVHRTRTLSLYFLPVLSYQTSGAEMIFAGGLLLKRVSSGGMVFERFGHFETRQKESFHFLLEHQSNVCRNEWERTCRERMMISVQ